MNKTITIDGITYNLTPVEPEPAAKEPPKPEEPPEPEYPDAAKWERAERGNDYWTYTSMEPIERLEENDYYDKDHYSCANYFATRSDAQEQFDREALARRIQRWRDEHDPVRLNWNNCEQNKYYICYNNHKEALRTAESHVLQQYGATYFSARTIAEQCIAEFGDEIKRVFYDIAPPYVPLIAPPDVPLVPIAAAALRRILCTTETEQEPAIFSDKIEAESLENEQKKKGDN